MVAEEGHPPAASPQTRRLLWLLLLIAVVITARTLVSVLLLDDRPRIDFAVFHRAGEAVNHGQSPYRGEFENHRLFIYPQAFAYFVAPLARVERARAAHLWLAVTGLLYILVVAITVRWARRQQPADTPAGLPPWFVPALAAAAAFAWTPVAFGWRLGQSDLLITFILCLVYPLPSRWKPLLAGLLLGLATILKVSPILLCPMLALALGWRFAGAVAAVLLAYVAALSASGHLAEELYFIRERIPYYQFSGLFPACSIHSLVCQQFFPGSFVKPDGSYGGWMTTAITCVALASYAACGLALWWRRACWLAMLTCAVAFSHMASPFLEPQHYTTTLLVLPAWICLLAGKGDWRGLALAGSAWLVGALFLGLFEGFGGPGPQYALLLSDVILVVLAFRRSHIMPAEDTLMHLGFPPKGIRP